MRGKSCGASGFVPRRCVGALLIIILLLGVGAASVAHRYPDGGRARRTHYPYVVYYQQTTVRNPPAIEAEWIDPRNGFRRTRVTSPGFVGTVLRRNGQIYFPDGQPARLTAAARQADSSWYAALQHGGFAAYGAYLLTQCHSPVARVRLAGHATLRCTITYPDPFVRRTTVWVDATTRWLLQERFTSRQSAYSVYVDTFSNRRILPVGSLPADFFDRPDDRLSVWDRALGWLASRTGRR